MTSKITRKELTQALPNGSPRLIRAIENLLNTIPTQTDENNVDVGITDARASQGVSLSLEALEIANRSNVLLWLSPI